MEDDATIVDSYLGDPSTGFFAVFDGHGGSEAVEFCKNRLHEELRKALNDSADVSQALTKCFLKVDDQLRLTGAVNSGTTATVTLVRREGSVRKLYAANVGDSKAVLISAAGAQILTYDHKGSDPAEGDRVV
jgi:serine/threonine protein phosphatase PrpC